MQELLMLLGRTVCHQIAERSFSIGGQLPVCARCSGLFVGIVISHIYLLFFPRKARAMPLLPVSLVLVFAMLPFFLDGISSYMGFRETTNLIRLATGLALGVALPPIYMPLYQVDPAQVLPGRFSWHDLAIIAFAAVALGTVLCTGAVSSWWFWSLLIALGHVLVYVNVIGLVLSRLRVRRIWSLPGYCMFLLFLSAARMMLGM